MNYPLIFRHEAEEDLRQAYRWYEDQRKGLGEDFLLCVEAACASIQENPERFPIVHKTIRRLITRRFPYAVFYVFNGAVTGVLAVFHCRRDPKNRLERA